MFLRIEKIWFVYLWAAALVLLLIFASSCAHRKTAKTARNNEALRIIADVMDKNGEDEERPLTYLNPVHFETGRDDIPAGEDSPISENISWLKRNPGSVIILEGHCDERGGDHYNMELGDRRARAVKARIMDEKIGADRLIMVVSYGERRPVDLRHTPAAWEKNRRVEFIVR
jgi:peptidoglycan-associated lipoprotein